MHGLALLLTGLVVAAPPIELERDVHAIDRRDFALPILIDPARKNEIESLIIYVSEDRGKTWKLHKGYSPTSTEAKFSAHRDGLYWFAVQTIRKDGKKDPAETKDLQATSKVYVNSEGRAVKPTKAMKPPRTSEDLEREVETLRKTVEELEKRIRELEKKQSP